MTARVINNNLVVQTDAPGKLRAVFPGMKEASIQGKTFCAMPFTLDAARVLNNMGFPTQSPIRTQYEWPGRYTPRWYQENTAEFFTLNTRAHCHSAPRTGKTLSALWAADYLRLQGHVKRTLIVAPLSTLWDVWEQNIFESFPLRTFCVLHGSREKRLKLLSEPHDFYVVNHHGVKLIETELAKRPDINLVILDECFPAGTKVLTPTGERCIDTLEKGDTITSSWGDMPITHVFKRKAARLVRVTFEDGTYVECTPEHPFATEEGWLPAKDLLRRNCLTALGVRYLQENLYTEARDCQESSEVLREELLGGSNAKNTRTKNMSTVRGRVCDRIGEECSHVLLKYLWNTLQSNRRVRYIQELRSLWGRVFRPIAHGEVSPATDVLPLLRGKEKLGSEQGNYGGGHQEGGREEARLYAVEQRIASDPRGTSEQETSHTGAEGRFQGSTWWERNRYHEMRGTPPTILTGEFQTQCGGMYKDAARFRISNLLQSGLWRCAWQGSNRSGREQPQYTCSSGTGQEKRSVSSYVRVVSVQDIKQAGTVDVWNLEVKGPQDYIANGKVVHNCAVMRNARAKTLFKPMDRVLNKQGIVRGCWGLTGTPTPNAPTDAFGQCKLITPEKYKGHFTRFKLETMLQVGQFKWMPKRGHETSVARILNPSIRYERSVCTDMEPCFIERRAQLSKEQDKAYKQLINMAATEIQGSTVTAVNAAVLISKLVQTACGCVIGADGNVIKMDFGPRLAVLEELIAENNEKVLVFVPFTGVLDALAIELRKKWSVSIVDGNVAATKRTQIFRDFREMKDPHVLVCHPQVMAHGLDLTAASLSIWYAPFWKAEIYQQANARTDGSKQKVKIDIAHIYATTEERRIYSVLKDKGKLQDIVLALSKGRTR